MSGHITLYRVRQAGLLLFAAILFVSIFARGATDAERKRLKMIGPRVISGDDVVVAVIGSKIPEKIRMLHDNWFTEMSGYVAYRDETTGQLIIRRDDGSDKPGKLKIFKFNADVWNRNRDVDSVDFHESLGPLLRVLRKTGEGYEILPWYRQEYNGARWIMYEAEKALSGARKSRHGEGLPKISDILTAHNDSGKPLTTPYDWFEINSKDFNIVSHDSFSINLSDFRFNLPMIVTQELANGELNSYFVISYSITNPGLKTRVIRPCFHMIVSTMLKTLPASKLDNILYLNALDEYVKVIPEIGGIVPLSQFDFTKLPETDLDNLVGFNNLVTLDASMKMMDYLRRIQLRLGAFSKPPSKLDGEALGAPGYVFAPGQTKHGLAVFPFDPDMFRVRIIVDGLNNSYHYDNSILDEHYTTLSKAISDYEEYHPSHSRLRHMKKVLSIRLKRVPNTTHFVPDGVIAKRWEWVWDWPSAFTLTERPQMETIPLLTKEYVSDTPEYKKKHVCHFKWKIPNYTDEAQSIRIKRISLAVPLVLNIKFGGDKTARVRVIAHIHDDGYSSIYKAQYAKKSSLEIPPDRYQFRKTAYPRRWRDRITIYPKSSTIKEGQINTLEGISIFDLDDLDINDLVRQVETALGCTKSLPNAADPKSGSRVTSYKQSLNAIAVRLTEAEREQLRVEALKALVGDGSTDGELVKMFQEAAPQKNEKGVLNESSENPKNFMKRWNKGRIQLIVDADVGPAQPPVDDPTLIGLCSGEQSVTSHYYPRQTLDPKVFRSFEGGDEKPPAMNITSKVPSDWPPADNIICREFKPEH